MNKVKSEVKEFYDNFKKVLFRPEMAILPGQLAYFFVLAIVPTITLISYEAALLNLSTEVIFDFIGSAFSPDIANMLLNTTLNGLPIDQITLGLIARLKEQAGIHSEVVAHVLDAVAETIHVEEDMKIYTSGATNIFKYPELSDKQSAQEIISAFEEKQQLADLVTETLASEDSHGIQVYIGDETPVKTMKDCSVVTATYELATADNHGKKRDRLKTLRQSLCHSVLWTVSPPDYFPNLALMFSVAFFSSSSGQQSVMRI